MPVVAGLSLLAGVLLGLAATAVPTLSWSLAAGLAAAFGLLSRARRSLAVCCLAWSLLGLALAGESTRHWLTLRLSPPERDARVLLDAVIDSVPVSDGAELGFDAEVRGLEGPGARD